MIGPGLIGGVGGSITMASYGYWLQENGWKGRAYVSPMRYDPAVAYIVTAIFMLSLLVLGAPPCCTALTRRSAASRGLCHSLRSWATSCTRLPVGSFCSAFGRRHLHRSSAFGTAFRICSPILFATCGKRRLALNRSTSQKRSASTSFGSPSRRCSCISSASRSDSSSPTGRSARCLCHFWL